MKRKDSRKMTRRRMLQTGAGMAFAGTLSPAAPPPKQSVYEALGVKHIINATGTVTVLGGVSIFGGSGTMVGAVLALILIGAFWIVSGGVGQGLVVAGFGVLIFGIPGSGEVGDGAWKVKGPIGFVMIIVGALILTTNLHL